MFYEQHYATVVYRNSIYYVAIETKFYTAKNYAGVLVSRYEMTATDHEHARDIAAAINKETIK